MQTEDPARPAETCDIILDFDCSKPWQQNAPPPATSSLVAKLQLRIGELEAKAVESRVKIRRLAQEAAVARLDLAGARAEVARLANTAQNLADALSSVSSDYSRELCLRREFEKRLAGARTSDANGLPNEPAAAPVDGPGVTERRSIYFEPK